MHGMVAAECAVQNCGAKFAPEDAAGMWEHVKAHGILAYFRAAPFLVDVEEKADATGEAKP